jgi:hypothetical protein
MQPHTGAVLSIVVALALSVGNPGWAQSPRALLEEGVTHALQLSVTGLPRRGEIL